MEEVCIMAHFVLGIGYHPDEYDAVRREWHRYDVDFHFVDSTEQAVRRLRQGDYVWVTICSNRISNGQVEVLRSVKAVPIVLLSPESSIAQRAEYMQRGASDYILNTSQGHRTLQDGKDAVKQYLDLPHKGDPPLTIVVTDDMYFCLEHRIVEIRGQRVDLTPKEFDVLALLITHPRRVFTFEMTLALVWGEEYTDASRQVLWNHVSHLRQKMKVTPDVPEYVKNVRGVGYKYEPE